MKEYKEFLSIVEQFNEQYCSIYENGELKSLSLNFWNRQEIQENLAMREDWDIKSSYIPFYGDWHDIYCIDTKSSKVVYLNDERLIICVWSSTIEFMKSLSTEEIPANTAGIVSAELNF